MNDSASINPDSEPTQYSALPLRSGLGRSTDAGLVALCLIAAHYHVAADPDQLAHDLALGAEKASPSDIVRGARRLDLKARLVTGKLQRLLRVPLPAIVALKDGSYAILIETFPGSRLQLADPLRRSVHEVKLEAFADIWSGEIILVTRRIGGAGTDPKTFGFKWFLPSLWQYRQPFFHIVTATLILQIFSILTPLMFQVVIDKVLLHRSLSTLAVIVIGLVGISLFDVVLQYLRTYTLGHTVSRIDVELGARLYAHLLRLPLAYFESRAAGQTVARARELETIRSFLTGQGLSSGIDLLFAAVLIAVLFLYSTKLTLVVLASIPAYILIAVVLRPFLRDKVSERFYRGAESQQHLVESIVGIQTLKAAAVEPTIASQLNERLAAYVRASFDALCLATIGQSLIQYVSKLTTAIVLYLGAVAVIEGELTVGGLVAFNMIMGQVTTPILRLSQLWQDFQQVQVSVERLGDILNQAPEWRPSSVQPPPILSGAIKINHVAFRYRPDSQEILRDVNLEIPQGQVIGIVGPSGSGKSTLTKLMHGLYKPEVGQITIGGVDIAQVDPAWLRRQIGVVFQENILFNRTIHENIALGNPGLPRNTVVEAARLSGADEFIARLPQGYDTRIEERGANLSGGQRQRIAIARVLVNQPKILILDEATSALDYESERLVQANMGLISRGRTVIIIAHRLAAVRKCDRIVTIVNGRIIEDGSHDQLVTNPNGFYAKLWRLQSGAESL